jgi:hypothetical protein
VDLFCHALYRSLFLTSVIKFYIQNFNTFEKFNPELFMFSLELLFQRLVLGLRYESVSFWNEINVIVVQKPAVLIKRT